MNTIKQSEKRDALALMVSPLRRGLSSACADGAAASSKPIPRGFERQLDAFERRSRGVSTISVSLRADHAAAAYALRAAYWQELVAGSNRLGAALGIFLATYIVFTQVALVMSAVLGAMSDGGLRGYVVDRGVAQALTPKTSQPTRPGLGQIKRRQEASRSVDESFGPNVLDAATRLAVLAPKPWQSGAWWAQLDKGDSHTRVAAKIAATYARHEAQARRFTELSLEQGVYAARASAAAMRSAQQAKQAITSARPSTVQRLFVAASLTGAALLLGGALGTISSIVWVFPGAYLLFGLLTSHRPPDERTQHDARRHGAEEDSSRGHADGHRAWARRLRDESIAQQACLRELSTLAATLT